MALNIKNQRVCDLARDLNLPLLFVGEDFSHTDVLRVEM